MPVPPRNDYCRMGLRGLALNPNLGGWRAQPPLPASIVWSQLQLIRMCPPQNLMQRAHLVSRSRPPMSHRHSMNAALLRDWWNPSAFTAVFGLCRIHCVEYGHSLQAPGQGNAIV